MRHLLGRWRLDRYFGAGLGRQAQAGLRAHLEACRRCQERYRRHLVAEALLPDGERRAEQRLWRDIRQAAGPSRPAGAWAIPALVAAAVVVLVVARRPPSPIERGAPSVERESPAVHLYRVEGPGRATPVGDRLAATDALAVAYSNPGQVYDHLMVFAVDQDYRVLWFYPAFQQAGDDPSAIAIARGRAGVELGEQISHQYRPGKLRVYALFLDHPERVSRIEAVVAERLARPGRPVEVEVPLAGPGAYQQSRLLEVGP
jgi:hypothetical protein